jgi:prepilin-type N-terminal cleavage/methylation domain-containing protein
MSLNHHAHNMPSPSRTTSGFTLIEMAIVLIILTLVVGGALVPLGAQIEQRRRAETQKSLDETKEALIGYAIANKALPCPSTLSGGAPTGIAASSCSTGTSTGYLPWATLGVTRQDAWGNLLRYAVSPGYTTNPFTLTTSRTLTIASRDNSGAPINITKSSDIPALVLSVGKNGYGGMSADFIAQSGVPANNPDEKQNISNGASTYYSRTPSPSGTAASLGGEFDDMVVWISPNVLFNRMVAAGQLSN